MIYRVVPNVFRDSIALVAAQERQDEESIARILDSADDDIVLVLTQMLRTAIRTPAMTIDEWVEMRSEKSLKAWRNGNPDAESIADGETE